MALRTCWLTTKMMMSFSEQTEQQPIVEDQLLPRGNCRVQSSPGGATEASFVASVVHK